MQRKQIIILILVVTGVSLGVVAAQWRICKTSPDGESVRSSDQSVQLVMYTTTCRRWWAGEDDQETLSYVMLPASEHPPAKPDEADIVYQVNWLKAGRSEAITQARPDLGTKDEVRGALLLFCEKSWCPKPDAILKQVDQWQGHHIYYERK